MDGYYFSSDCYGAAGICDRQSYLYYQPPSYDMGVSSVPAFLTKIWTLVDDPSTDELIAWDSTGTSFHVYDQARFAKEILPHYFKHSNIASFIRQLNMYGFRKVVHVDSGSIKCEVDDVEFQHPYFIRGRESLLEHIKRKPSGAGVTNVKTEPGLKLNQEDVTRVLSDVETMKGKQDVLSNSMDKMKKENEALWREVATLRQRHMKQQQIVNKLIQFMIHLVGGNRSLSKTVLPKRKMPLMINDSGQVSPPKRPRCAKQLSIEELQEHQYVVKSPNSVHTEASTSNMGGPVIHDVTDAMTSSPVSLGGTTTYDTGLPLNGLLPGTSSLAVGDSDVTNTTDDILNSSLDSTDLTALVDDNSSIQIVDAQNPASALGDSGNASSLGPLDRYMKDNPIQQRIGSASTITLPIGLSGQLDTMQDDIDSLKDLLSGGQYNFDPNTMLSLFNPDTTVPSSIENLLGDTDNKEHAGESAYVDPNNITGTELVQYQRTPENFLSTGVYPDLSDLIESPTAVPQVTSPMPYSSAIVPPSIPSPKVHTSHSVPTSLVPTSSSAFNTPSIPDLNDIVEVDPMSFINTSEMPDEKDTDVNTPFISIDPLD